MLKIKHIWLKIPKLLEVGRLILGKLKTWSLNMTLLLLLAPLLVCSQHFKLPQDKSFQKLKFQLVNNLIVVPVEVNGTKLHFLLDSGVSQPILFNISNKDSVQINNVTEITIRGVGHGEPIKALSSSGNTFKIDHIVNQSQKLYVVMDKGINLSPSLGITIHGIMGYELFRDFVVDISYAKRIIRFFDPEKYEYKKSKKMETMPLAIRNKKAYVQSTLFLDGIKGLPVTMLVDTGSSDAVWLFENEHIKVPEKHFDVFLGKGLNGLVYGKRTKIKGISLGDFLISDAKAAFPDELSYSEINSFGNRNGSLGGEILKRFDIVFDYSKNQMAFKRNKFFKEPFYYNLSGLNLQHNGMRYIAESIADNRGIVKEDEKQFGDVQLIFENKTKLSLVPEIVISAIRAGSPAHEAGLRQGDVILAVNGKRVHKYQLQDVVKMVNEKEGKRIKLLVDRYNSDLLFTFKLTKLFQ